MPNPIPAGFLNFPIVDVKTGRPSIDFLRFLQNLITQTTNLNLDGSINGGSGGDIDPSVLAAQVANLDANGIVLPGGVDMSRAYINKFLQYIPDGGGRYAALVPNLATQDNLPDGASYSRTLAAYVASGVPYNFKGAWSSATAYLKGAEVSSGNNYWLALLANTNSAPAIGNANWQLLGPVSLDSLGDGTTYSRTLAAYVSSGVPYNFQGAWSSVTAYPKGAEVANGGNYWLALASNTNSAPAIGNPNWQTLGPVSLDNLGDGITFNRLSGQPGDAICHQGTSTNGTSSYDYRQFSTTNHLIASGDKLQYDVWIANGSCAYKHGIDFICSDATTLRGSGLLDQNGLGVHPNADLTGHADGKWYHRVIDLTPLAGKTITSWYTVFDLATNATGNIFGRIANVQVQGAWIFSAPAIHGSMLNLGAGAGPGSLNFTNPVTWSQLLSAGGTDTVHVANNAISQAASGSGGNAFGAVNTWINGASAALAGGGTCTSVYFNFVLVNGSAVGQNMNWRVVRNAVVLASGSTSVGPSGSTYVVLPASTLDVGPPSGTNAYTVQCEFTTGASAITGFQSSNIAVTNLSK